MTPFGADAIFLYSLVPGVLRTSFCLQTCCWQCGCSCITTCACIHIFRHKNASNMDGDQHPVVPTAWGPTSLEIRIIVVTLNGLPTGFRAVHTSRRTLRERNCRHPPPSQSFRDRSETQVSILIKTTPSCPAQHRPICSPKQRHREACIHCRSSIARRCCP